ncbi:hypothetical protein LB553_18785 [Mesorhizobium sp. CA8]|uniref:hypothetical protein n=1 Tax=Mesorhizobium sp. CA8 TaxID=2876637 RepID=UPI001CCAAAED|nr:hypothetical protein [Mesorhizobium sp. CA8]MBZ9762907.1 hypothetical protein [Mesorhizobium sp. CA8]
MRGIATALLDRKLEEDDESIGDIAVVAAEGEEWSFSGLVMISFSAFDDFDLRPLANDLIRSSQVGLLQWQTDENDTEFMTRKTPADLAMDFQESFASCRQGLRSMRWRAAVETLETDDLFAEGNVATLLDLDDENWGEEAVLLYKRLSSAMRSCYSL